MDVLADLPGRVAVLDGRQGRCLAATYWLQFVSLGAIRPGWAGSGWTGTNVLVIEQLAVAPAASTRLLPVSVPPVHPQALAL